MLLLRLLLSFRICRMRAVFQWSLATRTLELGKRTLIMGIVNVTPDSFSDGGLYLDSEKESGVTLTMPMISVTPDSFSDGGLYLDSEKAIAHALHLLDEGADIVDIGGESTRPGASVAAASSPVELRERELRVNEKQTPGSPPTPKIAVSAEEELRRVVPVITELKKLRPDAVISIDTYKASVA